MADFLFYLFAALTVGSALSVALNRNAVNAAMSLFLTFVGMAGLFVLLEAYFLAVLQILVYAGAARLPLAQTYADVAEGEGCALLGSSGRLELAVNQGSAAKELGLGRGDRVRLRALGPA